MLLNGGSNMSNVGTTTMAFNAPPIVDLDGSAAGTGFTTTFTENGAVAIGDSDLTITDPDSAIVTVLTVELTNAKDGDALSLAGALPAGISSTLDTSVPGRITLRLTGGASQAEYMAALGLVRFSSSNDNPDLTDRDITVMARDGEGDGPLAHATVHMVAVNDAPVASIVPASYNATEQVSLNLKNNGLSVSDIDGNNGVETATLSVGVGQLTVTAGGSGAAVGGSGTATVTITGTLAQINALLNTDAGSTVSYFDPLDNPSASTVLTLAINDNGHSGIGSPLGASDSATINVAPVNDAPAASIVPISYNATEQVSLNLKNSGLSVSDIDGNNGVETATLSVGEGQLTVTAGGSGAVVGGSGTATVTITGTLAQINALLNSDAGSTVSYFNQLDNPAASTLLTLSINDNGSGGSGGPLTASDSATINVAPVNDAPVATIAPTSYDATEQVARDLKNSGLSVSDIDGNNGVETATLSVGEGQLTVTAGGSGAAVGGSGTGTVTITGTLAQINALLNTDAGSTVSYLNPLDNPSASTVLTLAINDNGSGGSGGPLGASDSATINVAPVNDAPTLNGVAADAGYTENGSAAVLAPATVVGDPDNTTLVTARVRIVGGSFAGAGNMLAASVAGTAITVNYSDPTETLTLSGIDTLANYQQVLRSVSFFSTSDNPTNFGTNPTRTLAWEVDDGSGLNSLSNIPNTTLSITAVNDAPVLADVATGANYRPHGAPVTIDAALTISDIDSATLASATVRVSAGAFAGDVLAVSAGGLAGTAITAGYDAATETLTLSGVDSLAHYEQVLEHVTYESTSPNPSNANNNPTRTIEWVLNDGGGADNLSAPQHTTINLDENPTHDFNADGFSDILWQNDNGQPGIWTMNGLVRLDGANVGFNPNGIPLQTGEVGPWKVKAAGDFNADGHADILWQNDNGSAGIWLMDGFNVIGDGIVGFNPGSNWKVIDAADFNADGHADILWQNDNGTAGIWTMDGLNRIAGANVGFNPGPSWHVKAAGDFNADGHADILWQNDNGTAGIWLMDEFNVIGDGNVGFNPGPSWKVIDAGDFNADGHSDILWQNENGTPGIWTMDGLNRIAGANVGGFNPGPSWKVKAAGDYNGDGRSDILWQNDNGQPGIWLMDGFNVVADGGVGFNPGPSWNVIGQHDLIGG